MSADRHDERKGERGHLMAGLLAAIAIMMIFSTLTFQKWEDVLRRDNEAEMIFRGQEIARGIQKYRKDHGGAPPEKFEDLMEPGPKGNYYMRRLYEDPLVRDGKWGILYVGPNGTIVDPSAVVDPNAEQQGGGSLLNPGGLGNTALPGSGLVGPGSPGTANAPTTGIGGNQSSLLNPRTSGGQEIAGLPIAGVKSLCTDKPFRVYKGFADYAQWTFTYLDLEQAQLPGQGNKPPGAGAGQGTPGLNQPGLNQPGQNNRNRPGNNGGRTGPGRLKPPRGR